MQALYASDISHWFTLDADDLLHANFDEACHLAGVEDPHLSEADATDEQLAHLVSPLLRGGVGVVALTLGASGAYVAVSADAGRLQGGGGALARAASGWQPGEAVRMAALPVGGEVNANGAGDAFTAGMIAALLWRGDGAPLSLERATALALGSAAQRIDSAARESPREAAEMLAAA